MPLPTIAIPGFDGLSHTVNTPNSGRQAAADSAAAALSTEDFAALGATNEAAPGTDTTSSGLNGRLQRVAQRLTSLIALVPTALGQATKAGSLAVTVASDDDLQGKLGSLTETAPATDTASSGLNGRLQRVAQRVTALITNLGSSADAVVGNGAAGSVASYLRTIKDAATDTSASSIKIDQTTPGTTDAVTVKTPADVISFTPTLDTAAYASGDVLFATASLGTVTRATDGRAVLMSLTGIDKSKNKPAMTLLFYQTNVTSAAANAQNNLSDADQANLLGYVRILAADWIDYANNSIVCKTAINLLLEAASGAQNVYVVGILDAGTPTFAANDLVFKLGVVQS